MEANLQSNFNVGFTNMRSDVLIHLTQWQYWWWFWFSLLWAFYYLMILKMVRFRSLKFRPRLATTFRPHGKWGDLIVCVIPVSWCANIITNSNFILRMIEWQSESGLLGVRIRGKQWYWVYKFELKTFTDVHTIPKNVGHNKWQISTPGDMQVADDYLHILQLRSHNRWVKTYWEDLTKEVSKSKNFHLISPQEQLKFNFLNSYGELDEESFKNHLMCTFEKMRFSKLLNIFEKEPNFFQQWPKTWIYGLSQVFIKSNVFLKEVDLREMISNMLDGNPKVKAINSGFNDILLDDWSYHLRFTDFKVEKYFDVASLQDTHFLYDYLNLFKFNSTSLSEKQTALLLGNLNNFFYKYMLDYNKSSDNEVLDDEGESRNYYVNKFLSDTTSFDDFYKSVVNPIISKSSDYFNWSFSEPMSGVFSLDDELKFDISDSQFENYTNDSLILSQEFVDKNELPFFYHENLFTRLSNKKSNWDELESFESIVEPFSNLIRNKAVFPSREDNILNKNFMFNNYSKIFLENKFWNDDYMSETSFYNYSDFNEFDRLSRKNQGTNSPVRLIKYPVSNKTNFNFDSDLIELFRFRYNDAESTTSHRSTPNSAFLIIRQKRYKRRKVILPRTLFYKDEEGNLTKKAKSSNYTFLNQNKIILENDFNATKRYKFFKKNKVRDELTNLVLSKRILRTRRTLVLPAHLNITAITNSFDVIHSWFIPGLGLKMDAIPGRATHHTFYIDNVGFYYGQCAEICGRYHHHMPIRICALPFEHFLLWWQSFGLPKLLFTKNFRRYSYSYGSRKYSW
jgi:heme/copper-type cytochrome/quinol oxidase subunit 2